MTRRNIELMNDKGVCRTAPATLGLLIIFKCLGRAAPKNYI